MNVICIVMDTLNRNWLTPYGASSFPGIKTPETQRLADRSVTFTKHFIGSAPTIPMRRDMFSGRLGLPFSGWGPYEPFDPHLGLSVQLAGTHQSHLVSDNAQLWNAGCGFYHTRFDSFEMVRGSGGDRWKTKPDLPHPEAREMIADKKFRADMWLAHTEGFANEADFHGPRVFRHAADWVDKHHRFGPFFLAIDNFDVHEPFDCPEPYRTMFLDDPSLADPSRGWTVWPEYGAADRYSPEHLEFLRAQYAGVVAMNDAWMGRLWDTMDRHGLWDDTVVVYTSDHGFYLGEANRLGKFKTMPTAPVISHIPLIVHWPGSPLSGKTCDALTTVVDLHPTMLEAMGAAVDPRVRGRSMAPLLEGGGEAIRDFCLFGSFGGALYGTDGRWYGCKGERTDDAAKVYQYGVHFDSPYWGGPQTQVNLQGGEWEAGEFIPHAGRPVFRKLVRDGGRNRPADNANQLFDLARDYECDENLWDTASSDRERFLQLMVKEMKAADFPVEQYERLELAPA